MSQETTKENTVIINLDSLDSTRALKDNELIFKEQCNHLVEKIWEKAKENLSKIPTCDNSKEESENFENEPRNVPSCYFIDGARGSGKSTLLRSVRAILTNDSHEACKTGHSPLFSLADVDPTELGKGENFLIYLLGRIYKILENRFKRWDRQDEGKEYIRKALENLRRMSSGLHMLMDSDEALKKSDAPEFFLENCIEKCASSTHLRENLNDVLNNLSKITGKDIFLVTIDDADLNFSKCEDVLEYIRKYMQSPRLIFLFAGDLQLYAHIVRGMQFENFHQKQLNYDSESNKKHRYTLMDSMEDQYLMKLFPVDNRLKTHGLKSILTNKDIEVCFNRGESETTYSKLDVFIREYLIKYIHSDLAEHLEELIFNLPLRSILFLLRHLAKNPYIHNNMLPEDKEQAFEYIWKGIQSITNQALRKYNINYTMEGNGDIPVLQKSILQYYANANLWNADMSLRPSVGDSSKIQASIILSEAVRSNTQPLSSKLKYWCSIFPVWQGVQECFLDSQDANLARNVLDTHLRQETTSWADLACSIMASSHDGEPAYRAGVICIQNENLPKDPENGQREKWGFQSLWQNFLSKDFETLEENLYVYSLNSCLCRIDDNRGSHFYLSIYHLLMNVANWLDFSRKQYFQGFRDTHRNEMVFKRRIKKRLADSRTITSCIRRIQAGEKSHTRMATRNFQHITYKGPNDDALVDRMYDWLRKYDSVAYSSSSDDFYQAWVDFISQCELAVSHYSSEYTDTESCPEAGKLFNNYTEAIKKALKQIAPGLKDGDKTLSKCVSEFPLFPSCEPPKCIIDSLNKANIGKTVNLSEKNSIKLLKEKWEKAEKVLHESETSLEWSNRTYQISNRKIDLQNEKHRRILIALNEAIQRETEHTHSINNLKKEITTLDLFIRHAKSKERIEYYHQRIIQKEQEIVKLQEFRSAAKKDALSLQMEVFDIQSAKSKEEERQQRIAATIKNKKKILKRAQRMQRVARGRYEQATQ